MDENKIQSVIKALNLKVAALEQQQDELTQSLLNVESLAGKRIPYDYCVDIEVAQGATGEQSNTATVSRAGPFFAERLICAFRIKTGLATMDAARVGRYLPLSSRWVYPFMATWKASASLEDCFNPPLDFEWAYEVSDDDRQRSDKFLPGDILERCDNDGIFAVSDIFAAGSTVRFKLNPLRAVGNEAPWNEQSTGVENFEFNAVFHGYKLVQPIQV